MTVANLPLQGWYRTLTTDEGLFRRRHRCQRCGALLRIGIQVRHEFWPAPLILGSCCAGKMTGEGNFRPVTFQMMLRTLRETWTRDWFPTAVRNGYLRNLVGRFALATAVILPAGQWWFHEQLETYWYTYVYLPGRTRQWRRARTPVAAAEAAYDLLAGLHP